MSFPLRSKFTTEAIGGSFVNLAFGFAQADALEFHFAGMVKALLLRRKNNFLGAVG